MLEAQQKSLERGEKTALLLEKSEELQTTSYTYLRTAKQTKSTMCIRKWKYIIGALVAGAILGLLIWLIFFK